MHINPSGKDVREVRIAPCFIQEVNEVEASHMLPDGELYVKWQRKGTKIDLQVKAPECVKVIIEKHEEEMQ